MVGQDRDLFQSPIGTQKTSFPVVAKISKYLFQSPIGTQKTMSKEDFHDWFAFQSPIGTQKTQVKDGGRGQKKNVSIPYRYTKNSRS